MYFNVNLKKKFYQRFYMQKKWFVEKFSYHLGLFGNLLYKNISRISYTNVENV